MTDLSVNYRKGDRFAELKPASIAGESLFRSNRMEPNGATLMRADVARRFVEFAKGRGLKVQEVKA